MYLASQVMTSPITSTHARKMTKEERRRSKTDIWVNLPAVSHSPRAGDQDARLLRTGGPLTTQRWPSRSRSRESRSGSGSRSYHFTPVRWRFRRHRTNNVPHHSRTDSTGTVLDELHAPTIPGSIDLAEPERIGKNQKCDALNVEWDN